MDVSKMTEEDARRVIEFLGRRRCMSSIEFVKCANDSYIVSLKRDPVFGVKTSLDTERLLRYGTNCIIGLDHPSYVELLDKCLSIAEKYDLWIWSYYEIKTEKTIFMQKGTTLEQLLIDVDMSEIES